MTDYNELVIKYTICNKYFKILYFAFWFTTTGAMIGNGNLIEGFIVSVLGHALWLSIEHANESIIKKKEMNE